MNTTLLLTLVLISPVAPIPKDLAPAGLAPFDLKYERDSDGVIRFIEQPRPISMELLGMGDAAALFSDTGYPELSELKGLRVYTVDGQEVRIQVAAKKLAVEHAVSTDPHAELVEMYCVFLRTQRALHERSTCRRLMVFLHRRRVPIPWPAVRCVALTQE